MFPPLFTDLLFNTFRLPENVVELVVRPDPNPLHSVALPPAHHAQIKAHPDRPVIRIATEFLKLQRIMARIRLE